MIFVTRKITWFTIKSLKNCAFSWYNFKKIGKVDRNSLLVTFASIQELLELADNAADTKADSLFNLVSVCHDAHQVKALYGTSFRVYQIPTLSWYGKQYRGFA